MINEELLGSVRRMTNSRLIDMVKKPDRYTLEEVQAARIVVQERALTIPKDKLTAYQAKQAATTPKPPTTPRETNIGSLTNESKPTENAKAKPLKKLELPRSQKSKGGFSLWWILFAIYLIFKFVMKNTNN